MLCGPIGRLLASSRFSVSFVIKIMPFTLLVIVELIPIDTSSSTDAITMIYYMCIDKRMRLPSNEPTAN